eukprot:403369743
MDQNMSDQDPDDQLMLTRGDSQFQKDQHIDSQDSSEIDIFVPQMQDNQGGNIVDDEDELKKIDQFMKIEQIESSQSEDYSIEDNSVITNNNQ